MKVTKIYKSINCVLGSSFLVLTLQKNGTGFFSSILNIMKKQDNKFDKFIKYFPNAMLHFDT